jgi:hypothetical protein
MFFQASVADVQCTAALPSISSREKMSKEVYEFDLQNKMEGYMWDLGDGIKVKCWKSLLSRVKDADRFKDAFELKIGSRCDGPVEECKRNNQTLPFFSYTKDGLTLNTTNDELNSYIETASMDSVQVGHLNFEFPTLDYATQLPAPVIFSMRNFEGEEDKTFEVRRVTWAWYMS